MMLGQLFCTCIGLVESLAGPLGFKPATVCTKAECLQAHTQTFKKGGGGANFRYFAKEGVNS